MILIIGLSLLALLMLSVTFEQRLDEWRDNVRDDGQDLDPIKWEKYEKKCDCFVCKNL
jgi:hypothetical protein